MRNSAGLRHEMHVCYGGYQPIYVAIRVCSTYIPTLKFTNHFIIHFQTINHSHDD